VSQVLIHNVLNDTSPTPDRNLLNFSFASDYLSISAKHREGCPYLLEIPGDPSTVVPIIVYRRAFLRIATFIDVPAHVNGALLTVEQEQSALQSFVDCLLEEDLADRISAPQNWCLFQCRPPKAEAIPFGTYLLDLNQPIEEIWKGLHSKTRNVIRRAQDSNVEVRSGANQVADFFSLYQTTMARNGLAFEPLSLFNDLIHSEGIGIYCGVSYVGNEPQSGVYIPYTSRGGFYLYGGTAGKMHVNGANALLHFEAIKYLQDRGVSNYNLVGARLSDVSGTPLDGIQRFKSRFGGELQKGIIWKQDLRFWRCLLFDILRKMRASVGLGTITPDIIDQESDKRLHV
jgi:hypothetical protein